MRTLKNFKHVETAVLGNEPIGKSVIALRGMTHLQRVGLGDEIHADQPNLLCSVLVLNRYGASDVQLEVVLNILFVIHLAMRMTARQWPPVTESIQERCLMRLTGRLQFLEGLTPDQQDEVVVAAVDEHREPWLLAFAYSELQAHGLLGIATDVEQRVVLSGLNLVECVTEFAHA